MKRFLAISAGVLGTLLLAASAFLFYLRTDAGQRLLRSQLEDVLKEAWPGTLEWKFLSLSGLSVAAEDVSITDADGKPLAEVSLLTAKPAFLQLLRGRLAFSEVRVRGLHLHLPVGRISGDSAPKSAEGPSSFFSFGIRQLRVEDSSVDYTPPGKQAKAAEVAGLSGEGSGFFRFDGARFRARLQLSGESSLPVKGPANVFLSAEKTSAALTGQLQLKLPGAEAVANGNWAEKQPPHVNVQALTAPPWLIRMFYPEYPLVVPVTARGETTWDNQLLRGDFKVEAGDARLSAQGALDVGRMATDGVNVSLSGVNLKQLLGEGPETSLSARLTANGEAPSWSQVSGKLTLNMPTSSIKGQRVGPFSLSANAQSGVLAPVEIKAQWPGAALNARGKGSAKSLTAEGELSVSDASAAAKAAQALFPQLKIPLSGQGALRFSASGAPLQPSVKVTGSFPSLAYGAHSSEALELTAEWADATDFLRARGTFKAKRLLAMKDVEGQVRTEGREVQADLRSGGASELSFHLGGALDEAGTSLSLNEVSLSYPEAEWKLDKPSRISFSEEALSFQPIVLSSGEQRVAAAGFQRGEDFSVNFDIDKLSLSALPKGVVPAEWQLEGLLSADGLLAGTMDSPRGRLSLSLAGGRFRRYEGLSLNVDGEYDRHRATGTSTLQAKGAAAVQARFDVASPFGRRSSGAQKLQAELEIRPFSVEAALAWAKAPPVAKGQARATAKLSGTLAAPVVSVSLFGEELEYSGSKLGGLELHVDTGPGGKLTGKGRWNTSPGALSAELQTPYTLKQLWNGLPSRQALMKAPLEGTAQLSGFNLAALSPWALPSASGLADGTVSLRGSLEAPLGTADVTARQLSIQGSSPIDASAKVQALANGVTVEFKSTHKASPLLELAASAEAPLGRFFEGPRAWANVPLRASGKAGPLSPTEWAGTWVKGQRRPTFPDGKLSVQFDAQGSLESPAVRVDGRFDEMKWGKAPLGRAEFSYGYDRRLSKAEAQFYSSSGNTLTATGTLDQDLSYDTWKQPLSLDGALNAAIRAEDFDISALNGIIPGFRSLAGRLSANGKATGTLSAPVLRARAELQNGQFAMDGYGQYRDVHLSAEADEGRFQLHELSGKSGSGDARLSADAVRKGGEFAVTAQLETKQFPIVFDDQLWAILDLRAQGEGTHVPGLLDFSRVTIPSARIELPEVKRKDLQPLMRPPDVFLWSDGQPMGRRRRGGAARGAAAASKPMEIRLALFAPKNLWLRGTDINTELGLSDGFRVEITDAVALHGRILFSDKGRISVLGKRFDIQRDSALSFGGPPQTPYINVTAVYVNEREGVKVLMTVVGQGKDLTLKPSSEPPLPENEIYTLLATGRRTLKRGSGSSLSQADAASVVGSAFAAQLKKTLAAKLPLDVLSIEAGDEGLSGTKVEAGTYVTDDVYVGYSGKLGPTTYRENSNAVRLEYQFAPHWSFETEFGDARVGGADLIWSRDF